MTQTVTMMIGQTGGVPHKPEAEEKTLDYTEKWCSIVDDGSDLETVNILLKGSSTTDCVQLKSTVGNAPKTSQKY